MCYINHFHYLWGIELSLETFRELWYGGHTPTLWCERYAHPLHRVCPVVLNYEKLPQPFNKLAQEMEHEGKTGDRVHAKPETCYACDRFVGNKGMCDPV